MYIKIDVWFGLEDNASSLLSWIWEIKKNSIKFETSGRKKNSKLQANFLIWKCLVRIDISYISTNKYLV